MPWFCFCAYEVLLSQASPYYCSRLMRLICEEEQIDECFRVRMDKRKVCVHVQSSKTYMNASRVLSKAKVKPPDEKSKVTLAASLWFTFRGQQQLTPAAGHSHCTDVVSMSRLKKRKLTAWGAARAGEKRDCTSKEPRGAVWSGY